MASLDDDDLTLSTSTLALLNDFLTEKTLREQEEQDRILTRTVMDSMFEEDWQLSQFWYNDKTKTALGSAVEKLGCDKYVALLSCPSLYKTIKNIHHNVNIFEFDKRFSVFGDDFIFYDFNEAFEEPKYLGDQTNIYDVIIADPPFLSEDCIRKTAQIMNKLKKPSGKLILCSGEVVEPWVAKYLNLKRCNFRPEHERNLGNHNEQTAYEKSQSKANVLHILAELRNIVLPESYA